MSSSMSQDSITVPKVSSAKSVAKRQRDSSTERPGFSVSRRVVLDETSSACGAQCAPTQMSSVESKQQSKERLDEIVWNALFFIFKSYSQSSLHLKSTGRQSDTETESEYQSEMHPSMPDTSSSSGTGYSAAPTSTKFFSPPIFPASFLPNMQRNVYKPDAGRQCSAWLQMPLIYLPVDSTVRELDAPPTYYAQKEKGVAPGGTITINKTQKVPWYYKTSQEAFNFTLERLKQDPEYEQWWWDFEPVISWKPIKKSRKVTKFQPREQDPSQMNSYIQQY